MKKLSLTKVPCPKCRGQSRHPAPSLTKKQWFDHQAKINEAKAAGLDPALIPKIKPNDVICRACYGSGLIDSLPPSLSSSSPSISVSHGLGLPVLVIGSGIAGSALTLALQQRNIPVKCIERDPSFDSRRQGYGLTMQQGTKALERLGFAFDRPVGVDLMAENKRIKKEKKERQRANSLGGSSSSSSPPPSPPPSPTPTPLPPLLQQHLPFGIYSSKHLVFHSSGRQIGSWGKDIWDTPEQLAAQKTKQRDGPKEVNRNQRHNVHIARQELRGRILAEIRTRADDGDDDDIVWGKGLKSYECVTSDEFGEHVEVTLTDDTVVKGSVLVGCDGIHSIIRTIKLGDPLRFLKCFVMLGIVDTHKFKSDKTRELCDGVTAFQSGDGLTRIFSMPFAEDKYMWQLSWPISNESDGKVFSRNGQTLRQEALRLCDDWHSEVKDLLTETDPADVTGYNVYDREVIDLKCGGCVTMCGDAAHPMSPFKGQGANQALLDAIDLARVLHADYNFETRRFGHLDGALDRFETKMMGRAKEKVEASAEAALFLHTEAMLEEGNFTRGEAARMFKIKKMGEGDEGGGDGDVESVMGN